MAYGWPITNGVQIAVGSAGYIARFNLSNHEPESINFVQMKNSADGFAEPLTEGVDRDVLAGYVASATPPNAAFCMSGVYLDVFVKTAKYPYNSGTEIGIDFQGNAINGTSMDSTCDVPQEAEHLMLLSSMEILELEDGGKIPPALATELRKEIKKLQL